MSSLYDFVNDDYEAPTVVNNAAVDTPHANRQDLHKPYVQDEAVTERAGQAQEKREDKSYYSWWRYFVSAQTACSFEQEVNVEFRKLKLDGEYNFLMSEYIKLYRAKLNM